MELREATGDDIRPLQDQFSMSPQWAERNRNRLSDEAVFLLIAEATGQRLGFVEAHLVDIGHDRRPISGDPESILRPQRIGNVDRIRIADTADSQRVVAELMRRLTARLRSLDVKAIEFTFGETDRDSGAMMEQLGFNPSRFVLRRAL